MSVNINRNRYYENIDVEDIQHERNTFIFKSYITAAVFVILTLVQWIPLTVLEKWTQTFHKFEFISLFALFGGFVALIFFANYIQCRIVWPYNWLLAILIVECFTLGIARTAIYSGLRIFGIGFLIAIATHALMAAIGVIMKYDITDNIFFFGAASVVFFIISIIFMILVLVTSNMIFALIFCLIVITFLLTFTVFHVQIIVGGRTAELDIIDHLMASLILYFDIIVLVSLTVFGATLISAIT